MQTALDVPCFAFCEGWRSLSLIRRVLGLQSRGDRPLSFGRSEISERLVNLAKSLSNVRAERGDRGSLLQVVKRLGHVAAAMAADGQQPPVLGVAPHRYKLFDRWPRHVDADRLEVMLVSRLTRALSKSCNLGEFDFMPGDSGRLARRTFKRIDFNGKNADSKRVYGVLLFSREGRSLLALFATSPLPPGDERRAELVTALLTLKGG